MQVSLTRAIDVFARGFAFTRCFTHPYLVERIGEGIWALKDAPRKSGDYRKEEYIVHGLGAAEVDRIARERTQGRYMVCVILGVGVPEEPVRAKYRELGYRLMTTEAFMVHGLSGIKRMAPPHPIVRVATQDQAKALAKAARTRQILPEHLKANPAPMRKYMALDGERPVGWVGCVSVGDCGWCSNMYVEPRYRRKGLATALMSRMLGDDRKAGFRANVLLASHAGEMLYRSLAYDTIGKLLAYVPLRRKMN